MAKASISKRIRLTHRAISRASGSKKQRLTEKLNYLLTLTPHVFFNKGKKMIGEGGYR